VSNISARAFDDSPTLDGAENIRVVATMAARLGGLDASSRVLSLGSGYGGAARWLAEKTGCRVTCVNLNADENARNRALTAAAGLDDRIEVIDASFDDVPCPTDAFDVVWSQTSILQAQDRPRVFREIDRLLNTRGEVIFTDPMQSEDCSRGVADAVLEPIPLETFGSMGPYRDQARSLGWQECEVFSLGQGIAAGEHRHLAWRILHFRAAV
jgi:sarcosine/dimethylglycine N-methyltransferase